MTNERETMTTTDAEYHAARKALRAITPKHPEWTQRVERLAAAERAVDALYRSDW